MNDTDTQELTVTADGIDVEKRYETDAFSVPAVGFRFRSNRDDATLIRLVDTVPPDVPSEDIGFHPDHGNDHWTIEGNAAVFERRFEPNETYETVYAIRTTDHDPEGFMTDPTLDVRDGGDPEARDTDATPDGDHVDPDAIDADGGESRATDRGTADRETAGVAASTDGVGAALAAELRDGTLDEEDRALLEAELMDETGSTGVRMTHLQSRVSDLEAYTDALEGFFDENGTVERIDGMTDRLETLETGLDDLAERTNGNETTVAAFESRIENNEEDIDAIDKGVADVQATLDELQESIEELRADVAEIDDWRGRVSSAFGGAGDADDGADGE